MSQAPALMANAIRALAMDAVQAANSGHPGAPMGMAECAVALWGGPLKHNPADPRWPDRDRFVLSNGHGSMLLYALLHLSGYALPISELQAFRKLHSKTPATPRSTSRPAWRPPPGRSARASPMRWAWPWPRSCWHATSTAPATPWSTTTATSSWATAA
jgi:transketolase N-terminal domain/subunit